MRPTAPRLLSSQFLYASNLFFRASRQQHPRFAGFSRLQSTGSRHSIARDGYTTLSTLPASRLKPLRSGVDPVVVVIANTKNTLSGYIVTEYIYPPVQAEALASTDSLKVPATQSETSDMAMDLPGGRPGNLTAEQELRLKELWMALFEIFGSVEHDSNSNNISRASSISSSPKVGGDSPNLGKKKHRMSWLKGKNSGSPDPSAESDGGDDKYGATKEFKRALGSQSKEDLRRSFWDMLKHDDPDAVVLRYLRARKWNVQDALVMMISAFHWRNVDMRVDQDIMSKGEEWFQEQGASGEGTTRKDSGDLMAQLHMGKSMVHGVDKENRPITIVRARLHRPGHESDKSLEMYTVYVIETARLMLRHPVDTATIIFDMTSFSLSNMDYAPIKFIIKCFEANYPESLGSVLVYKAPWLFSGIWKIIKGWLDPVVASKVSFCSNESELEAYIDRSRMIKEVGGDEDWGYEYIPPRKGENDRMKDTETRDKIVAERRAIADEYDALTLAWARDGDVEAGRKRKELVARFQENYWRLDPYVRARSLWDRTGVLGEGGKLDFYPEDSREIALPPVEEVVPKQQQRFSTDGESVYHDASSHLGELD